MLKNQSQFNVFFFNDSNQSRSRSRSISFCWFLGGFVLLYAPLGRPHGVCPPRRASQWPYKVIGSSFDISYACCTWYMALLDYTILYYSVSSVLSCLPFLQNPVCATTHDLLTTQQTLRCLCVQLCSLAEQAYPGAPASTLPQLVLQALVLIDDICCHLYIQTWSCFLLRITDVPMRRTTLALRDTCGPTWRRLGLSHSFKITFSTRLAFSYRKCPRHTLHETRVILWSTFWVVLTPPFYVP